MSHDSNITPVPRGWLKKSWVETFCTSRNADGASTLTTNAIDKPDLLQWVRAHHVPQLTFSQFRTSLRRLCVGVKPNSAALPLREDLRVLLSTRIKELGQKTWGSNDRSRVGEGRRKATPNSSAESTSISQSRSIPDSATDLQDQQQRKKQKQKQKQQKEREHQADLMQDQHEQQKVRGELFAFDRMQQQKLEDGEKDNGMNATQQPQDEIRFGSILQTRERVHAHGQGEEKSDDNGGDHKHHKHQRTNEKHKRQRSIHKSRPEDQYQHHHHHHHRHTLPSSVGDMQSQSPDSKQCRVMTHDEQQHEPIQAENNTPSADIIDNSINNTTTDNINIVMNNNNTTTNNNKNNNNNNDISSNPADFFVTMADQCEEMQEDGSGSNCSTPPDIFPSSLSSESIEPSMPSMPSLPAHPGGSNGSSGTSSDDATQHNNLNLRNRTTRLNGVGHTGIAQMPDNGRFDDNWTFTGLNPVVNRIYRQHKNSTSTSPTSASDLRRASDLRALNFRAAVGESETSASDSATLTSATPESETSPSSTSGASGASKSHTSAMSTSTAEAPSNLRKFDRLYLDMSKKFKHIGLLSTRMYPALERHFTSCFSNPALMCFTIFHADTTVRRRPAVYANGQACRLVGIDQTKVYHDIFTESSVDSLCKAVKKSAKGRQDRLTFVPKLWTMVFDEYGNYSQRLFDFWVPQVSFNDQELPMLFAPHRIVSQQKEPGPFAGVC